MRGSALSDPAFLCAKMDGGKGGLRGGHGKFGKPHLRLRIKIGRKNLRCKTAADKK